MPWLALVPRWLLALLAGAAIGLAGWQWVAAQSLRADVATLKQAAAELERNIQRATVNEQDRQRSAIEGATKDAKRKIQAATAAAAAASDALGRMLDRAASTDADSCDAATAAARSDAAAAAAAMRADMLRRLGEAAGQLAAEADRRGAAGSACQAAW
jgi:hypothetical protein